MRSVPWWALLSSACAPVLLVGGWTVSAVLQGPGYDPGSATISILASDGAQGYWVMTSALVGLGVCDVVTACGLRPAARAGRVALGGGGLSAMLLAFFPAPASGGSLDHGTVVAVGFALLALWPVLAVRRPGHAWRHGRPGLPDPSPASGSPPASDLPPASGRAPAEGSVPWGLRPRPSLMAAGLMWLGGGWFLLALFVNDTAGAAERVVTFAQAFWPLVVVVSCVRWTGDDARTA
ncbi:MULTISPECIES: DUF998 domain-containing protein [unclassified Streptomyces]|uniref:DUF998 domain-containing protein n=1 Tax=unclassified Streptomyces TaxID=2593676 RepID=UPI000804DAAC|nr:MULTISPECIES: DUF998 domain-containing protein [unclassified Streptomyces]MYR73680.1 DUF998 domain-containing protein [Streptomyces sp. SID4925]SBV02734.1 Protein of unknown function (DUF998) [Streptomyces sp. OspMP-M45]SCE04123.1 Protein of unknown function [Streptomyces sp. PpalLS-921]